jgi:hypothetical protein
MLAGLKYSRDPTARGDEIAAEMRAYYEANKPLRWWQRRRRWESQNADSLMLGLLNIAEVARADATEEDELCLRG